MGETASRARKRIQLSAKAKTVTVAKRERGDAGAVFDLAPNSRLGVGPASSKRWGDGGRKKGEDKQPNTFQSVFKSCPESAENRHGRDVGIFPGSGNFPQSPAKIGGRASRSGFRGVCLEGELKSWPSRAAGPSLSPPDSDCGTERSGARAGGRRSSAHAESSGVKRSEPDGVRPIFGGQSVIFSRAKRQPESRSLPTPSNPTRRLRGDQLGAGLR